MNLEGMSKKQLLDLTIELAGSLAEEDLHDPETYAMVGQLLDILDDSSHALPQEMIEQLKNITNKQDLFQQAVQMVGLSDPSQLDRLAHSLKQAGLLKSEDIDLIKAAPLDLTNSHILMFPVKIKGEHKSEDPEIPDYHVTLKWLGTDKNVEHSKVQDIVKKHKLHPPKITHVEPITWKSPRGDIHVLALHGDHDNLHAAHQELSDGNESIHPYVPHITVSKELHDQVKSGAIRPSDLGIECGALEYKIGPQHIKSFTPAPEAEEHFIRPNDVIKKSQSILKKIEALTHPVHYSLKDREHFRNALKVADLKEELNKYEKFHSRPSEIAHEYASSKGLTINPNLPIHKADPVNGKKMAYAYENMAHEPNHPAVKKAYDDLIKETTDQYKFLKQKGLKISRIESGMDNPYKGGSKELRDDIHNNHHIHFFPTDQGFGSEDGTDSSDHPMLKPSGEFHDGKPLLANDLFRIVHDYFGHAKNGHTFNATGEDNAWKAHMQMYSPSAQRALTTETRGQNSWVNYGPHGDKNRADPQNTTYAAQKAGLMPDWAMEHEDLKARQEEKLAASEAEAMNKSVNGDFKDDKKYRFKHHEFSGNRGQSIRVYHGSKRIGHLAFSSHSRGDGFHDVFNSEIDREHRGKGIYKEMLRLAGEKAVEKGSKGIKSEGFQRSPNATRVWDKVATHAEPFTNNWKVGNMEGRKRETSANDTDYFLEPALKKIENYKHKDLHDAKEYIEETEEVTLGEPKFSHIEHMEPEDVEEDSFVHQKPKGWLKKYPKEQWGKRFSEEHGMNLSHIPEQHLAGTLAPAIHINDRFGDGRHRAYFHHAIGEQMPVAKFKSEEKNKQPALKKGQNGDWKKEGYTIEHRIHSPGLVVVSAKDSTGKEIGGTILHHNSEKKELYPDTTDVDKLHRRKGLASGMYTYAEKTFGAKVKHFPEEQSDDAAALWANPNKPFGKSELIDKAKSILQKHRK